MRGFRSVLAVLSAFAFASCQTIADRGTASGRVSGAVSPERGVVSPPPAAVSPVAAAPSIAAARLGVAPTSASRPATAQSFAPMNRQTLIIVGVVVAAVLVLVLLSSGDGDSY